MVYMAKVAEQAERYEDMVFYMKKVASASGQEDLSLEERNLLSVAYKNVVGARRASLRIITSIESKELSKDASGENDHVNNSKLIKHYKEKVEEELNNICEDILSLLANCLITERLAAEPQAFSTDPTPTPTLVRTARQFALILHTLTIQNHIA